MWLAPVMGLVSTGLQMKGTKDEAKDNAATLREQGRVAAAQGYADEETQRREARQVLGAQAAALAQSGTGTGGTNAALIQQSATNAEMDALNIRYAGLLKKSGFDSDARATVKHGKSLAGAQLLQGVSGAYTSAQRMRS